MAPGVAGWERVAEVGDATVAGLALAADGGVIFAATPGGVYRSVDDGRSWRLARAARTVPLADAVAATPDGRSVFVGAADGLHRSTDAGETWQPVLVGSRVLSVAVSGTAVLAGTETDGVLRSEDGGRTWVGANAGLLDLAVLALALSPAFETDGVAFLGTASGVYRSRNGARAWRAGVTDPDEPAVQCLAVSPGFGQDRLVLAGTEADGLLRAEDGGATWRSVPGLPGPSVTALAFGPGIAAATNQGVFLSDDGGVGWRPAGALPAPVLSLAWTGAALVAGLHKGGVARSGDHGATWASARVGGGLFTQLAVSPAFAHDRRLFLAGPDEGVWLSADGGATWSERKEGLDDATLFGLAISADYARDRCVYAATSAGIRRSRDGGASWQAIPAVSEPVRAVATAPPSDHPLPTVVAALADGRLVVSDDRGQTWRSLGAPFDGAQVASLAVSDRSVFAACKAGSEWVVWRWTETDGRWRRWLVEPADGTADTGLLPLAVAPDGSLFAALGARVLRPAPGAYAVQAGERRPLWRSASLPAGSVTALAVSPGFARDRTVLAATSDGVFVSLDGGQSFAPSLASPGMLGLALSPGYPDDGLVYALGLGGGLWRAVSSPSRPGSRPA
jgi:hypothetical protein